MKTSILFSNFLDDLFLKDVVIFNSEEKKNIHLNYHFLSWEENFTPAINKNAVFIDGLISLENLKSIHQINSFNSYPENDHYELAKKDFSRSIDRIFLLLKSIEYCNKYFYGLVNFWEEYLKKNEIRIVFFDSVPHTPWDIVLFHVSKLNQIQTVIKRRTIYSNILLFSNDFRSGKVSFFNMPKKFQDVIEDCVSDSSVILRSKKINTTSLINLGNKWLDIIQFIRKISLLILNVRKEKKYFQLNKFEEIRFNLIRYKNRCKSIKLYKNISSLPDFSKKYIYFPLHFRPERSTVPEGGNYYDQITAIKKISFYLPDDYLIYVKEHPRQLGDSSPDLRRLHQDEVDLYIELLKLDNIRIIDININSEELIKNAKLIASITGSSVWEGITYKIPGITFGNTWHSEFIYSPDVSQERNLKDIMIHLLNLSPQDISLKKEEFIADLRTKLSLGAAFVGDATNDNYEYQVLIENYSHTISHLIRNHQIT